VKVALGTFELDDEGRKAIKKELGYRGGKASRDEAREFLLRAAERAVRDAKDPEDGDE
jgi:hypothetical protein